MPPVKLIFQRILRFDNKVLGGQTYNGRKSKHTPIKYF